ncbi:ubl carboxyl-terminal hydrolase 18 [Tachyglossus aculeatus]|uniref:ubl carboxyl-terminal hydrolase 18 n=1 Tax=Tachyglossus aculeatus TaxID=9261 RepID=UPI0018F2C6C4|nr:ubl carboxyl-terminal hydrolase 18 [Tachyglossus aculeatus]XP_038597262.1 ubl carboxyl-terminal hydrolase 18 [Tachyglossus aculeatus]
MGRVFGQESQAPHPELTASDACGNKPKDSSTTDKKRGMLRSLCHTSSCYKGPVGLYNIGQTCSLNSLLQVFFMNREFTRILKRIQVPWGAERQRQSVPYQLLLLLEKMQDSRWKAVQPLELAFCLQEHNVQRFVQHDAAELFQTLWNLIMNQITDSELTGRLNALYTIQVLESLLCRHCSLDSLRWSNMLTLSLPLFDAGKHPLKTVEDSLRCFFQPREPSGLSKCERCGEKTPKLQTLKLVSLPQTLTIHLQRFRLKNSETQKVGHPLHFPQSLDLGQILPMQCDTWDANGQYELFAVIAHVGTANFGHYCAYICNPTNGKWLCFNDSSVCWVSWEDIKCTYGKWNLYWGETAYLLVYMRSEPE